MKKILTSILILLPFFMIGQTANVTKGCVPLSVDFSAPIFSSYYWDFDDGATSTLPSPQHVFINPGTYNVELRMSPQGGVIGTLEIKVYADPEIQIFSSAVEGCSPFEVSFNSQIDIDPEILIQSLSWTFGDGVASDQASPTHIYETPGLYDVALKIETNIEECNKTFIVEDLIFVSGTRAEFSVDRLSICDPPATFQISNATMMMPGISYTWNFGNGQSSTEYDPVSVTYEEEGVYPITLLVEDAEGCTSRHVIEVQVGQPQLDVIAPDTICRFDEVQFFANIPSPQYSWIFEGADISFSDQEDPELEYNFEGSFNVYLEVATGGLCINDTMFQIVVEQPTSSFSMDPISTCHQEATVTYTADEDGLTYLWNFVDGTYDTQSVTREWTCPPRDSHYVNYERRIGVSLIVETERGCKDTIADAFLFEKPEAYFVPDRVRGCAPLTINIQNTSWAGEEIILNEWDYGDGSTSSNNDLNHPHTYEEPGEYYIKMNIETIDGCRDTSAGVWIFVGEALTPEYTIDKTEICLGDSIEVNVITDDDRIDAWHFYSDDGRFDHCWDSPNAVHSFITEPGTFDGIVSVDYNGCITNLVEPDLITVNGAKALIDFMINCETPNDIMLNSQSLGAELVTWQIENETFNDTSLTYSYSETGDYAIILEAADPASMCPSTFDTVNINIRNLEAIISAPDTICQIEGFSFDGSQSIDVDPDCSQGWLFDSPGLPRPFKTDTSALEIENIPGGHHILSLIVQDVNGCRDTAYHDLDVYGIYPEISISDQNVCVPADVEFLNLTTADTTLVQQEWSFGSNELNPTLSFEELPDPPRLSVSLFLEDAVGCRDTIQDDIDFYEINSTWIFAPGPVICPATEVFFFANQFEGGGSFLEFEWDFGNGDMSTDSLASTIYEQAGTYAGSITYMEAISGCSKTEAFEIIAEGPEANFSSNFDGVPVICHPDQIQIENMSSGEFLDYTWTGSVDSKIENPTFTLDKGTHVITLIVTDTVRACIDTISQTFTLVGPEGSFDLDKDRICLDDEVTFTLKDTVDVSSYLWDFGDGNTVADQNPITHTFDQSAFVDSLNITLIVKAIESGCEFIKTLPIEIVHLVPEFEISDFNECLGSVQLNGINTNPVNHEWDFGDGNTDTGIETEHIYAQAGAYEITYSISDPEIGCRTSISQPVEFEDLTLEYFIPNVFTPNGDERNDFFNIQVAERFEENVDILAFKIFNRWGELIYDNLDPENGWDGRFEAELSPAEVYAYFIEASVEGCEPVVIKGNITLLR